MRPYSCIALLALMIFVGCDSTNTGPDPDTPAVPGTPDDPAPEVQPEPEEWSMESYRDAPMASLESYDFDFALPSVEGETVSKADFDDKVLVVDIWATWCGPCRVEVPHFVELQEELGDEGLAMVGINYEGTEDEEAIATIKEFTDEVPVNYPLLLGDEATQNQVPDFQGYPTTIFMDRTGKVRLTLIGARPKEELKQIITTLLEEEA